MNNFQLTMAKFIRVLQGSYYISSILTAMDTAMIVFILAYASLLGTLSNETAAAIGAVLFTAGIIYMIEVVATVGILPMLESFKQKPDKDQKKQLFYGLGYLALASFFSMFISFGGRASVAETIIPPPTMINPEGVTSKLTEQSQSQLSELNTTIAKAESERKAAVNAAGNGKLRELAHDGNEWAKSVLEKEREKAAAPYTAAVASLSSKKLDIISGTSANINKAVATITEQNTRAIQSADNLRNGISGFMMWGSIILTLATWVTGFVMAGLKAAAGKLQPSSSSNQQQQSPPPPPNQQTAHQKTSNLRYAPYNPTFTAKANPNYTVGKYTSPVITTQGAVITGTVGEAEVDRDEDTNAIVQVKINGKALDKTKMKEYLNVYKKRAENDQSEYDVRLRNYKTATTLNESLWTLYGEQRIHIVEPEKPLTWQQQDLFNQTT